MPLHKASLVSGKPAEYVAPVSTESPIDGNQRFRSQSSGADLQIWKFSGVLMNSNSSGSIGCGVNNCSSDSAARILPPALPRTSSTSPFWGKPSLVINPANVL